MITAKIIADSISNNIRLTTMELNYPRFIHSEFMTHRMFSRNASSSRAIPIEKMIKQVEENPAMPIHWGKNQPGMQAREECNEIVRIDNGDYVGSWDRGDAWLELAYESAEMAQAFNKAGYHKQIVNRLLEPFQWTKVIVTATEWDNFFKLRLHTDAQPEIAFLATKMREAMEESTPKQLSVGEWHLPYVKNGGTLVMACYSKKEHLLRDMIKCSIARCARVSYLNHDKSDPYIEKDIALADRLLEAGHMSPFEHIATPMDFIKDTYELRWETGVTHKDREDYFWSGNFRGWIQYRQLIGNNNG